MNVFGFEPVEDAMFQGMRGKEMSSAQDDLLRMLCKDLGEPVDVLGIIADEMGRPDIDRQVASLAISLLKEGGTPVAILRKRVAEKVHGQGGLF